jgi:predicted GTPase
VDTPGFDEQKESATELVAQAERGDLILWVASATQPARGPDRERLDEIRSWAREQLSRRTPPILLALTHVDELRPAAEWTPPYDVTKPAGPKARSIRAAMEAAARALDLPVSAVIPLAVPPNRDPYNLDALWARIAVELDEAKLVQLDRLRIGQKAINLRTLAEQFGRAGRTIIIAVAGKLHDLLRLPRQYVMARTIDRSKNPEKMRFPPISSAMLRRCSTDTRPIRI